MQGEVRRAFVGGLMEETELTFAHKETPKGISTYIRYCTTEPLTKEDIERIKEAFKAEVGIERVGNKLCLIIEK